MVTKKLFSSFKDEIYSIIYVVDIHAQNIDENDFCVHLVSF